MSPARRSMTLPTPPPRTFSGTSLSASCLLRGGTLSGSTAQSRRRHGRISATLSCAISSSTSAPASNTPTSFPCCTLAALRSDGNWPIPASASSCSPARLSWASSATAPRCGPAMCTAVGGHCAARCPRASTSRSPAIPTGPRTSAATTRSTTRTPYRPAIRSSMPAGSSTAPFARSSAPTAIAIPTSYGPTTRSFPRSSPSTACATGSCPTSIRWRGRSRARTTPSSARW